MTSFFLIAVIVLFPLYCFSKFDDVDKLGVELDLKSIKRTQTINEITLEGTELNRKWKRSLDKTCFCRHFRFILFNSLRSRSFYLMKCGKSIKNFYCKKNIYKLFIHVLSFTAFFISAKNNRESEKKIKISAVS